MSSTIDTEIYKQQEFYETKFANLNLDKVELRDKTFENCQFGKSTFKETKFIACKFVDCEFKSCDLSNAQFNKTTFSETIFDASKLLGINWAKLKWPCINLNCPMKFYKSNISHSSFYELNLTEIIIEDCKAHDVDFRGGDFSNGSFVETDFASSLFMNTKLRAADFTDAINYNINPNENDIKKAKFSMPEAMNLLHSFEIEILDF